MMLSDYTFKVELSCSGGLWALVANSPCPVCFCHEETITMYRRVTAQPCAQLSWRASSESSDEKKTEGLSILLQDQHLQNSGGSARCVAER